MRKSQVVPDSTAFTFWVNFCYQAIALKTLTSRHTDLNRRVAVHCRSLRGFREVLLKEILRTLRAFLSRADPMSFSGHRMVTGIREEAIFVRRDKQLASCLHAGDDQATTFFSPALL